MKYTVPYLPLLVSGIVILIVIHIVTAKKNPIQELWKTIEGFQAPIVTTPRCPDLYKFFNDAGGESFCCNGSINPYTHACTATRSQDLCAFAPETPDPRNPGSRLSLCSDMITEQHQTNQDSLCPATLPHYASKGKCCFSGTDLDGNDCVDYDNKDKGRYCILKGSPAAGEQSCSALQRDESATCPAGLQKTTYALGTKEVARYGGRVNGLKLPVCFNPSSSCIPDNVIPYAQGQGAWTDKNPATWAYACANWTKVNVDRDTTGKYDTNYL